ncbi:hypothetical protein BGZ76_005729 [Entomortierella beljakovae]|nr:hypothetical protein BGZ76_005729 [Entomortierella beljakovae]
MMFQSCPPTIESFKLHGSIRTTRIPSEVRVKDHMFKEPENEIVLNPRTEPLLNLKEMVLPRLDSPKSFYAESITEIMKRCPALEKWTFIDFARHDANMAMDEMFSNTCRKVRHIYVPEQHYAFDISTQARLYTSLPPNNLESIHWENFQYHKTRAFEFDADPSYDGMKEILQHHSKSLKKIQLNVTHEYSRDPDNVTIGSTLKKILGTCEALESLIVTQEDNFTNRFLEDLTESEWVCHGLNHLELYFTLSEDDGDSGDAGDHEEAVTKNNVLLDRLYSQIGRMSNLKVLDLKHEVFREYSKPEIKYYSVPLPRLLTLKDDKETGAAGCLSMLEGLTELRELRGSVRVDVAKVSNSMGQQEVEWMLKHWPNLRLAEFLPDNYDSIVGFEMPEHLKWLKDQKPGLRLSLE